MDNSLNDSTTSETINSLEQMLSAYHSPTMHGSPFALDLFQLPEASVALPLSQARQHNATLASNTIARQAYSEAAFEPFHNGYKLTSEVTSPASSPSSTFSQEAMTPASVNASEYRGLTPLASPTPYKGTKLSFDCLASQATDFNMPFMSDDLLRPFASYQGANDLGGNSLHLFTTPSIAQNTSHEQSSPAFEFSPQINLALVKYPASRSAERYPVRLMNTGGISGAFLPEKFYPTPSSTPQHDIAPLPLQREGQIASVHSPSIHIDIPSSVRPVRAAAAAAKRKASFADIDEDEDGDDFSPSTQKRSLKRQKPSCPSTSTFPIRITRDRPNLLRKQRQQKRGRVEIKMVWEEDGSVAPGTPVVLNSKVLDGCEWGFPVYAVCPANGRKSIRWRCNECSALLGRKPDLHRHWKTCFQNNEFKCGEVTHEDGRVWPGCGTVCSRQDAARRHIERRFTNGHCSLSKPNRAAFKTTATYETHLAKYNDMLMNSTWRATLSTTEKNRLAHSALPGMKTDIFKD